MKESKSITSAALLLATGILLSRLLGYAREMLLAYKFGAGPTTDAFYAAFQIPDLLNYFLAGGALSIAFIPLYNRVLARDGEVAAGAMMAVVLGTLGTVVIAATAVLWWQAPALIALQFPRFSAETAALTVHLTRIVLPAQIFFVTGGIVQAVLLARKSFTAAAVAPLVYNICIIAGGFFLYPLWGIDGFAIGTLVGAIAGPFLVPVLQARGHVPLYARIKLNDRHFMIYLAIAAPLMLGQTLLTLDEWYGRWFGALMAAGTVAHLGYARRLMQVPIAVIGQAVAAAALPTLSKLWAEGKVELMNATLQRTLRTGLFLAVLASAGFVALAKPIVALVYEHGAFTASDTEAVAALVAVLAFAIPGWILQQISVRAFYARGDTWRPMALGTALSILAIPLYIVLADQMAAVGIALAGAVGMTFSAVATLVFARLMHGAPEGRALLSSFARALAIAGPAVMGAHMALWARGNLSLFMGLDVTLSAMVDLALGGTAFMLFAMGGVLVFADEFIQSYAQSIVKKIARRG